MLKPLGHWPDCILSACQWSIERSLVNAVPLDSDRRRWCGEELRASVGRRLHTEVNRRQVSG